MATKTLHYKFTLKEDEQRYF